MGDENEGPSCIDWTGAALKTMGDAQVLRRVACCVISQINTDDEFLDGNMLGMSVVVGRQEQGEPQGGCVERYMTIQIQIPNCESC